MNRHLARLIVLVIGLMTSESLAQETQLIRATGSNLYVGGFGTDGKSILAEALLDDSNKTVGLRTFGLGPLGLFDEQPTVVAPPSDTSHFDGVISVSGDYAAMGAPYYSLGQQEKGYVTLFQHTNTGWVRTGQEVGDQSLGHFGQALDVNGPRMVVGEPGYVVSGSREGRAYVSEANPNWGALAELTPLEPNYKYFGTSVAVDKDLAVVGAPSNGTTPAAAFVFQRDAGRHWAEQAMLTINDPASQFGAAVDIRDGLIVVGAPRAGNTGGSACVYREGAGGAWTQVSTLTRPNASTGDLFGSSVSIGEDDSVLVGLPGYADSIAYNNGGAALYFTHPGVNTWSPIALLKPSVESNDAKFGYKVTLANGFAFVGAGTEFRIPGSNPAEGGVFIYGVPEPSMVSLAAAGVLCFAMFCAGPSGSENMGYRCKHDGSPGMADPRCVPG